MSAEHASGPGNPGFKDPDVATQAAIPGLRGQALVRASPSLALIKYWGKSDRDSNLPASPSIAMTLKELHSLTRVFALEPNKPGIRAGSGISTSPGGSGLQAGLQGDLVVLDGKLQPPERFVSYFDSVRKAFGTDSVFWAESSNNFPTAAGLASSSSGFAALSAAASIAMGRHDSPGFLSGLARLGSGSAARSLYGGFTYFGAGSHEAECLAEENFWPELCLLVVRIEDGPKEVSSRSGMESSRLTSPYYQAWVNDAPGICMRAKDALMARDLDTLGPLIRLSYLRMFATMFSADPPFIYWKPGSLQVIKACEELRNAGVGAWETMDAGPQVKIFCLRKDRETIAASLETFLPPGRLIRDEAGRGPQVLDPAKGASLHPLLAEAAGWRGK